jgi:site-specific DNA-methyltransferase (adenine-specific)
LIEAFLAASDGWSSDRVIVDPELNEQFCKKCRRFGLLGGLADWNRALMRLRKSGKLKGLPKPKSTTFPDELLDQCLFASEIAMRRLRDQTTLSLDDILCDPVQARRFDRLARSFAPGFSSVQYRWAALTIRKRAHSCRQWSQTLTSTLERRQFPEFQPLSKLAIERLAGNPGVYLARGEKNLYVGETFDLGRRFRQHLEAEGWRSVADDPEIGVIELNGVEIKDRWGLQSCLIHRYTPQLNYLDLAIP